VIGRDWRNIEVEIGKRKWRSRSRFRWWEFISESPDLWDCRLGCRRRSRSRIMRALLSRAITKEKRGTEDSTPVVFDGGGLFSDTPRRGSKHSILVKQFGRANRSYSILAHRFSLKS
jgi:hypothetical protein